MTVVALASAKGSPGVSMTAAALATQWPRRAALADVDPAGGDLVWRVRTPTGHPLDPDRGLLSLAAAARRGADGVALADHLQETSLGTSALIGVPSPEQLSGLGGVWSALPTIFRGHETDVIVDCGRMVASSPAASVLLKADVVVFVVRPDLEGSAHLRRLLQTLAGSLRLGEYGGPPVGVVVRAPYRDTRAAGDLQRLLDSEGLSVRVLGQVVDDPKGAQLLSSVRVGNVNKSLLSRSARDLVEQVSTVTALEPGRS